MTQFFVLVKREGFRRDGSLLSARQSAKLLLDNQMWPLWERTNCRNMVAVGAELLIYLSGVEPGAQSVIASAKIVGISKWDQQIAKNYPLMLDGIPEKVLLLDDVKFFKNPLHVPGVLDKLSFIPKNKSKWGTAFMCGMRNLSKADYTVLIGGLR